jgi:hypothetical protein
MQHKKQNNNSIYSRKLNTAQKQYTTTERDREMLSAIETCKEYKNILIEYCIAFRANWDQIQKPKTVHYQ